MKRVVLEHVNGPLAGLRQICEAWGDPPYPEQLGPFVWMGRQWANARLVKTDERYLVYAAVEAASAEAIVDDEPFSDDACGCAECGKA